MKDNIDPIDKIDAYLLGHLDENETANFKQEIRMDKSLAEKVAKRERLIAAMAVSARREMKDQLKEIHKNVIPEAKQRSINWRPLLVAASVAIIGLMIWRFAFPDGASAQQLFAENYKSYDMSLAVRADGADPRLAEVSQLYRKGDYQQAMPFLQTLASEQAENAELKLGLAMAYYETGAVDQALPILNQIIADKDPFLSDEASWYAALFLLKQDRVNDARPLLKDLAERPGADHQLAAKGILSQLQ